MSITLHLQRSYRNLSVLTCTVLIKAPAHGKQAGLFSHCAHQFPLRQEEVSLPLCPLNSTHGHAEVPGCRHPLPSQGKLKL